MTQARYSTVAIILHWLIAALLVWIVLLGWEAEDLRGTAKMVPLQLHKPLGILVLLLTLARLAWRRVRPAPPLNPGLKPWERNLAKAVHIGFYLLLLLIPLTGWAMVSASALIIQYPINMFGLFDWPAIPWLYEMAAEPRHDIH
ncbi:MAG TPA: cytochrome b/b6 domain-containing protein, partial [Caulobacter sp.]|nr:cytochrome b/b6 domain-containing protein [Caulobacter sp.]